MKTFTTYAEKKAKQILNLLQGYTKGIRITAILMLLLMGVSNAWGKTTATLYYSVPASTVGCYTVKCYYNFGYSQAGLVEMTKVDKTSSGNLIYSVQLTANNNNVDNLLFQLFDGNTWKSEQQVMSGWKPLADNSGKMYVHNTGWTTYSTDASYTVYFVNKDGWTGTIKAYAWNSDCDKNKDWSGADMTSTGKTYQGKNIYSITLNKRYANIIFNNGSSQTGDLTLGSTNIGKMYDGSNWVDYNEDPVVTFKANGGTGSDYTQKVNYNTSTALTANTFTRTGYNFAGWNTKTDGTGTSYTDKQKVTLKANTTLYAKWTEKTYAVTISAGTGGTVSPSGSKTIGQVTKTTVTATPNANYEFINWTATGGVVVANTTSASTTITATATGTLKANFRSTATHSLTVEAGAGIASVTGSTDPVTLGSTYAITATPKTGYTFSTWTANPAANATFGSATTANTTVTVKNGSVTVTASATENMSTLTTSNQYNAGDPGYEVPEASVNSIGYETTATVTATVAGNGYTFTGWTLTNCTRTDGGAADATSITVRSNGDGKAATVVANYAEDLTSEWHLVGNGNIFPDGWNVNNNSMMKKISGKSTESIVALKVNVTTVQTYEFKIVDDNGSASDTWYGYSTGNTFLTWTATGTKNVYSGDNNANNLKFTPNVAGEYEFKVDYSGKYPAVTITYPAAYKITYGVGDNKGTDAVSTNPSVSSGSLVLASTEITFSKGATKEGYIWKNWNSKADGTGTNLGTEDTYVSSNRATDITVYACYDLITYNITYNTNGGTNPDNAQKSYNVTTATFNLPTPTKTGYTFAGWYDNAGLTGNKITQIATGSTDHKEFWAKWTANQYTITWNVNDGSGNTTTDTYTYDSTPIELPNPTREGYTFNGWWNASSGGERINDVGKENKPTSNVTYYAHWTENLFLVTISTSANGSVTPSGEKQIGIVGLSVRATANTGYQFENWTVTGGAKVANANSASTTVTATAAGTVIANFSAINYTITYNNLDGGTNHVDNPTNYTIETPTITLQAPTRTGYSFAGWYTTNNFSGDPVTEITQGSTGNKTFYAKWIEQKEIYLVGEFGWDNPTEEYKFTAHPTKPGVYTLTRPFEKRDRYDMTDPNGPGQPEYEFKLQVDGKKYTVKTENGKKILQYTRQSKTKVLSDDNNYNSDPYYNLLLQADMKGDYVFEYNVESQELTVEHPAYQPEASYIVGDFSDGATGTDALPKDGGAGYDWTEEHGGEFDNNTVTICFDGTGKKWEFKIKINGVWYGAKDLVITGDGKYTLTDDYAFQSETNCAIQTSGVNGCYTFSYTEKGNGEIELTVGYPKQSENPTTVYLKPNDDWKKDNARFALYYWNNNGNNWKDMSPVDCNGDYYSVEVPKGYSNFVFCRMNGNTSNNDWSNRWNQTNDLTLPNDAKILYDIESTKYIYLTPNSNWKQSNDQGQAPRFAACFMNSEKTAQTWVSMDAVQGETDVYVAKIPENQKYVILCRMNGGNQTNDWSNKWNQTDDLEIPADKNHYTVKSGTWNNGGGTWSVHGHCGWTTYTEPTYDVTINITGKGAIVINGQTYEGTSEGKTKLTIEDIVVNQALTVTAITPADRWDYEGDATITIGSNALEPLKVEGTYEICGPTTINLDFMQKYCLVTFHPNPPKGVIYPEQIGSQEVRKGDKIVQPTVVDLDGYLFGGWYPNGSEYTDANKFDFDTPVEQDLELCARWVPYEQCIFFKNNLNWDNIYVYTFSNNVWHNGTDQENPNDDMGVQPKVNLIEHGKMTRIGFTDVYYYALTNITTGFNYIAFSDQSQPDNNFLYKCNAIYRGDRSDKMQLFIPQREGQVGQKRNDTYYYSEGIWMKYNSTESGYKWSSDKNGWSTDTNPFTAPNKGGYSFSTKVSLQGGTEYKFKVNNINGDWYGKIHTMTKENCTNLWLEHRMEPEYNTTIQPNVTGEYIFTIYLGDGKVMISLEYPLDINDYRLAYNDNTTGFHPGHYIRKRLTEEQLDTVSFFVHKDYSPELLLQKCIAIDAAKGIATWETVGEAYPIDVNSTSVYNFVLQQTGTTEATHQATVLMDKTHLYTGNFYIRTDKAPGGWDYFRQEDNMIHFSSYASDHEHFTHYFCKWIESSEQKGYSNVKYTIANDYSYCISDTLDNDDVIKNNQTEQGFLPANANVRFTWNNKDNTLSRAYISGSTWTRDRFLVLSGNEQLFDINIDDETGDPLSFPEGTTNGSRDGLHANEAIFADMGNWIYQLDVHANNQTKIKLTALYNEVVQYFKGSEKEPTALLRSTEGKNYKIRLIYDFKINKLISAWLAGDETIEGQDQTLGADMMIIRHNQEKAEQLNFDPTSRQLSDVGTAYAVMTFDKYFLNNRAEDGSHLSDADKQSPYARALYWISFPFDVKLSEVFGFGEYGDYWIMEYYDGEARAKNGLWADTDTYWKYITNKNYILQKGQGYVISLNLNKMGYESNIFDNTDEVSLYFPSNGALGTITGVPTNYDAPAHECTIDRENGIHKIYDSHWNVIGVPGFADIENVNVEGHIFTQDSIHFYYEYLPQTNEYRTRRAGGDKTPANFQTMYSYMVQYYGGINWSTKTFTRPSAIAARRTGEMPSQYDLRLELTTDDQLHDQTFLLLDEDKRATAEYDVNLDLTKIMNKNASIYTLAGEQRITLSGNTLPMEKAIVPVGVRIATAGEYTFRTPDGTDGISVTLVDNVTGTHTDMLMDEYTITLDAGTIENRFYLVVDPDRTATSVENIGEEAKGEEAKDQIKKFLIDGKLFIRTADGIFDAKGQRL